MKKLSIISIILTFGIFGIFYNLQAQTIVPTKECTNCLSTKPSGEGASAIGLQTKATCDYSFVGGKHSPVYLATTLK